MGRPASRLDTCGRRIDLVAIVCGLTRCIGDWHRLRRRRFGTTLPWAGHDAGVVVHTLFHLAAPARAISTRRQNWQGTCCQEHANGRLPTLSRGKYTCALLSPYTPC